MKIKILKNSNYQGRQFVTGESVDVPAKIAKLLIDGNVASAPSQSRPAKKSNHDSD